MTTPQLIRRMRELYDGFNGRASDSDLWRLQDAVGLLPDDVLSIYRDHDGSASLPARGSARLPARLLPIDEVIVIQPELFELLSQGPLIGRIAWLWADDHSNFAGLYTDGPLEGWLVKLDHEEPMLAPAWRSVRSFLERLLDSAPGTAVEDAAVDLPAVPRDVPALQDDPELVARDRALARVLTESYRKASADEDEDRRRLLATCAICLTPARDAAAELGEFLREPDMWTPETAIRLLEFRRYKGPVDEIERLARDGHANGDSAAMRLLVRMRTPDADDAVDRLKQSLTGPKLKQLDQWLALRDRLSPPRWY